ncbi:phosphatase PAP2 family protein [Salinimicrobium xinjiangense]|uniref:phosphatase PAP2 family protein n=1 Tax=Salinimicrobium xinjiangense TaxID=438596 RepID=UPI000415762D|nr:phosphatase PAP2 family protein [Salinimicrobium xinjiangense]
MTTIKNDFLSETWKLPMIISQPEILFQLRQLILLFLFSFLFLSPADVRSQYFNPEDTFIENTGDAGFFALPASAVATSLLLKDYRGTWQFSKSFALNLAVTGAAKVLINKQRPLQGGDHAFPSGHTSVAFQSASFYHRRYGFVYSIPAYLVAGYTGWTRIHATRHDGWDVLAGAVVGIGSTWFFTTPREGEKMELSFSSSDEHYMLGFRYVF